MNYQIDLFAALKVAKRFFELSGHWPERQVSLSTELQSFFFISLQAIFVGSNVTEIILHFSNFKDLAENLTVTAPIFCYVIKLLVFKAKRKQFYQAMDLVGSAARFQPNSETQKKIIERMNWFCIIITKIYGSISGVVCTLYAILSLTSPSILPVKFTYDFGNWVYGVYFFQIFTIMNGALNTVFLDMLVMWFMGTAISQLELLELKVLDFGKDKSNNAQNRALNHCIVHHSEIIQYLVIVEDIFSLFFLAQYISSIFTICNIGFQLANVQPMSGQFANMLCFFSSMMCQLSAYCWFGNEIIIKSLKISDACYDSDWLNSSERVKKSLIIFMIRANKQLFLTAGKYSILSLASLMATMKASYSYFALMQRLYNDQADF